MRAVATCAWLREGLAATLGGLGGGATLVARMSAESAEGSEPAGGREGADAADTTGRADEAATAFADLKIRRVVTG